MFVTREVNIIADPYTNVSSARLYKRQTRHVIVWSPLIPNLRNTVRMFLLFLQSDADRVPCLHRSLTLFHIQHGDSFKTH